MVSTRRCHMNGFLARDIFWPRNFSSWQYQLATKIKRFAYAKDCVNADKPSTLELLKSNICQIMAEIPPNICSKVIENYLKRINACSTSRGGHLNDFSVSHIMSTFKFYNKKGNIMKKYFIYVLFTFTFEITKLITMYDVRI